MYFSAFPYIVYDSVGDYNFKVTTNLLRRVALRAKVKQNTLVFDTYDLREGETPEIIAHKLYGDPTLHWIVLMSNDISDRYHQWPMKAGQFNQYLIDKYGLAGIDSIHHYELNQLSGDTTVKIDIGTSNTDYSPVSKSFNLATAIEEGETHIKLSGAESDSTGLEPQDGTSGWQFQVDDELLYTNLTGTTKIDGQIPELQFNNSYFVVDQAVDLVLDGFDFGYGRIELEQNSGVIVSEEIIEGSAYVSQILLETSEDIMTGGNMHILLNGTDENGANSDEKLVSEHTNNYIQISEQKGGTPMVLSPDDAGNTGVHHFAKITNSVSDTAVRVVTNREFEQDRQDSLRRIRLLKPEYIPQVVEEFKELMEESVI